MATKKPKTASKRAKSATRRAKIAFGDIQIRAQQIYKDRLQRGNMGDELSDWLQAEKELKSA